MKRYPRERGKNLYTTLGGEYSRKYGIVNISLEVIIINDGFIKETYQLPFNTNHEDIMRTNKDEISKDTIFMGK